MEIRQLIATYPRRRPALSAEWQALYTSIYKEGREGRTFLYRVTQFLEGWMHRKVASRESGLRILELGAGTLNHVQYEAFTDRYDVVEPFEDLYGDKVERQRIRTFFKDISDIPTGAVYDRVVSIATLEHITNLPAAISRAALLLAPEAEFRAGIPSEGGFLWEASWRSTVALSCRVRHGLDYGELMRHEHVNTATEIIRLARYLFRECALARFPFPFHHLSLYSVLIAKDPVIERCKELAAP